MKLVLLIVAGAFATQDVTPPVISLSFSDERYGYDKKSGWRGICSAAVKGEDDATCQGEVIKSDCVAHTGKCEWHSAQDANGHFAKALPSGKSSSASVMCYVHSDKTTCPDPTCTATDHHDTSVKCDDPSVVMIQRNSYLASKYAHSNKDMWAHHAENTNLPSWAGGYENADFTTEKNEAKDDNCVTRTDALNTNKWANTYSHKHGQARGSEGAETCVNRNTLGQYLVTYSARDLSGNEADKVSFSFLFVDPFVPHLSFSEAHGNTGYTNVMRYWPTLLSSDVGTGKHDAVYDSTALAVESTKYNTWGAFYSTWSTVAQKSNNPFALVQKEFSSTTTGLTGTDYDSTESRFDFENKQQPPKAWDRINNLEAGNCMGSYGGFISAANKGEEYLVSGKKSFCAANIATGTAGFSTAFLTESCLAVTTENNCKVKNGCKWIAACARTTDDTWAYPVYATASDNYRDPKAMKVFYKVHTGTWGVWKEAGSATTETLCMRPGSPYVIDWIVSDQAGIFGFEHKDNMQTHRIQITVSDNTRPVVYPVTYGTDTESTITVSKTDITEYSDTTKYQDLSWMTCKEMTQENICKGECKWKAGVCERNDGKTDPASLAKSAYSCIDPAGAANDNCSKERTSDDCWKAAGGIGSCVWTRTLKLKRSLCDKDEACTATELAYTVPGTTDKLCETIKWTDRSSFSLPLSGKHGSDWEGTAQEKCRSKKATGAATSIDTDDTTIFLECGTLKLAPKDDPTNDETQITADKRRGDVSSEYEEHGFLAEDNWDNYNNAGGCKDLTGNNYFEIHCVPTVTTPQKLVKTPDSLGGGKCHFDTTQLAHTENTGGAYFQAIEGAAGKGATFKNDYLVAYKYTDANANTAWPVTRRVVVEDTQPPELTVRGDCTIENSAGAHTNDSPTQTDHTTYACVASHDGTNWNHNNRFNKTCAERACADKTNPKCTACTGNCYWQRNSADTLVNGDINDSPTTGQGLFDHDRIAKFFDHRDDCDRNVVTVVTLHEGACDHEDTPRPHNCAGKAQANSKIKCGKDTSDNDHPVAKCALDIFKWNGEEVHDQSHADESIFLGGEYKQSFPEWEAGTYAIQYQTVDASGHEVFACRTIENVDHTHPIIQILGSDQMTLEATHQGNYIDDGATCSDQVDGVISQNVEVSGDVVNLSKVGTYTITYNCKDSANNEAPAAQRTVVVAQTSCPKCTIFGDAGADLTHEASFPYTDAGASCSDVIDGSVTTLCSTDNAAAPSSYDPSPLPTPFDGLQNSEALCADGDSLVNVELTGDYIITYRAVNTVGLANDDKNCRGGKNTYTRKVKVVDTLKPVITLKYSDNVVAQGQPGVSAEANTKGVSSVDYADTNEATALNNWKSQGNFDDPGDEHAKAGTLTLMAEQTTSAVNGWVIGAFASAVAGLALLGYSTRRTTVATSVPV